MTTMLMSIPMECSTDIWCI